MPLTATAIFEKNNKTIDSLLIEKGVEFSGANYIIFIGDSLEINNTVYDLPNSDFARDFWIEPTDTIKSFDGRCVAKFFNKTR